LYIRSRLPLDTTYSDIIHRVCGRNLDGGCENFSDLFFARKMCFEKIHVQCKSAF